MHSRTKIALLSTLLAFVVGAIALLAPPRTAQAGVNSAGLDTVAPHGVGPDAKNHQLATDNSGRLQTLPGSCTTTAQSIVSVGTTAVSTPSSSLANRLFVTYCNSPENSGSPKVKILLSGTPAMGTSNAGSVLQIGDCISFPIAASVTPKAISDSAGTAVTVFECAGA